MERKRKVDPVKALSAEFLGWAFMEFARALIADESDFAIVPTETGYFTAEKDSEQGVYVLTTWLPDRLLTYAQVNALAVLRRKQRFQYSRELR